jgi:hypothetical protein
MNNKVIEDSRKFFEQVIGIDGINYIELRIHDNEGKYNPISRFARTFEEIISLIQQFKDNRWNIYFGVNKRPEQTKSMSTIPFRYVHYFDIEHAIKKPPFTDDKYLDQLTEATNIIIKTLKGEFNLDFAALLKTGRGVSLYYKYKLIPIEKENKFKHFIKTQVYDLIKSEFKKSKLLFDKDTNQFYLKAWDSVFDSARINGCPMTFHTKYEEKPLRIVLKINEFIKENDVDKILDSVVLRSITKRSSTKNIPHLIFEKPSKIRSIFESQEFKILSTHQNLPEGDIKKCIIFPLKMLCRDINPYEFPQLIQELNRLGYGDAHNVPEDNYDYDEAIFRNWCYRNYKWCIENKWKVKYKLVDTKTHHLDLYNSKHKLKPKNKLKSMDDVIKFTLEFNKKFKHFNSKLFLVLDSISLNEHLKRYSDEELYEFIKTNDLLKQLKLLGV